MEVWKPKESIIKAIIAWAKANNFEWVRINKDFARGFYEEDDWLIQISFKEEIGLSSRNWPVRELEELITCQKHHSQNQN